MKNDHILQSLFLASAQPPRSTQGTNPCPSKLKSCSICSILIVPLFACKISDKNIDNLFSYVQLIILTFDPRLSDQGWGKIFDTVGFIYRHWEIMAHSEKLFDIIAGCFAFIVLQMSCYCKCSVTLLHGVVDWSAVCNCCLS